MKGEFRNALYFGVAAGHHAKRNSAWGGTYTSTWGWNIYITLRLGWNIYVTLEEQISKTVRIAIIDTDSHHGNGTRDVTFGYHNILHVCFCSTDRVEDAGTKICVDSGYNTTDENYLALVETQFLQRVDQFKPDIIVHLLGHDTARGDYGSRGLSKKVFLELVRLIKSSADTICHGRYLINTHGGSDLTICEYIHPRIIRILTTT